MAEKMKTDADRLLLVLIMKKNYLIYFVKLNFFLIFETKSILSTSVFSYLSFPKFRKQNFMYFGHEHVET